jgi:hypothetical protein
VGFSEIAGIFLVDSSSSWSSSSSSSDLVFLFVAVPVVVVVVDVVVVVRAVLALAAAVTMRVALVAGSDVFAAARARVILFGGDCGSILAYSLVLRVCRMKGRN